MTTPTTSAPRTRRAQHDVLALLAVATGALLTLVGAATLLTVPGGFPGPLLTGLGIVAIAGVTFRPEGARAATTGRFVVIGAVCVAMAAVAAHELAVLVGQRS